MVQVNLGPFFELVGTSTAVTPTGAPIAIDTITSNQIVMVKDSPNNGTIALYDFNGTSWAKTSASASLSTTGPASSDYDVCVLNTSTVAVVAETSTSAILQTYYLNNTQTYSQTGNTFSLSAGATLSRPRITALTSSRIVMVDRTTDKVRAYDWDGTDWARVGAAIDNITATNLAIAALTSNRIALFEAGGTNTGNLTVREFDGSAWTLIGAETSGIDNSIPDLTALNTSAVVLISRNNDDLRKYTFDGSAWTLQVSSGLGYDITGGIPSITALTSTRVVHIDSTRYNLITNDINDEGVRGQFTITANTPQIIVGASPNVPHTTFSFTGIAPAFVLGKLVEPTIRTFTLTANNPTINVGRVLTVPHKSFSLTGNNPGFIVDKLVELPSPSAFTITANVPDIVVGSSPDVPHTSFTITANAPQISTDKLITIPHTSFSFTGSNPSVIAARIIAIPKTTFSFSALAPTSVRVSHTREYQIVESVRYNGRIKGINVSCKSGTGGTLSLIVANTTAQSGIPFSTSSGNTSVSAIMNRGDKISVRINSTTAIDNDIFRVMRVDLALLRTN